MSELPPSPGDTFGAAGADAGVGPGATDELEGESGPTDVLDLLLHTEPDLSPAEIERKMGVGPAPSNAIVGMRKMLHGATGRGGGSGTPALVNFGAAAYHAVGGLEGRGDGADAGDELGGASDEEIADAYAQAAQEE
jgi:hypothetical protein